MSEYWSLGLYSPMGRNFASQWYLGSIMWDGRADSFESHVIQDCLVIQDQMDLHLGLRWGPHILGNTGGGMYYKLHLGYSSILPPEFH